MRVFNRKDFMELPEGVIYAKGQPWYWGPLSIKADTTPHNDFVEMSLVNIDANDSGEWSERLERMLELGESYPMQTDCYGRDGCFDDKDVFLVYEQEDLKSLIGVLSGSLSVVIPTNKPGVGE